MADRTSSPERVRGVRPTARQRSAVTNGSRLFVTGDGNSPWTRRYRDLIALHADDLGGPQLLSEAQASLIRRAAAIEVACEQMEGAMSAGEAVDLDVFTRSVGHLRRVLETIGIERMKRDVTPSLARYLQDRAQTDAEASGLGKGDGHAAGAGEANPAAEAAQRSAEDAE